MRRKPPWSATAILLLSSIFSLGCPKVYRSETAWHADGSVDRAIYQDWGATPDPVRRSSAWREARAAPDPQQLERSGWTGPIAKLPVQKRSATGPYFAAWGRFRSPEDIPAHFVRNAPEGAGIPDSELVRNCRSIDYVFVREFRWRETLSDRVKLEEMRLARAQLANLFIDLGRDSVQGAFGHDYDVTSLENWLRTEGKTWLAELTDHTYLSAAIQKGPSGLQAVPDGWADICERHGLALKAGGKFLENEELEKVLREFLVQKILQHVRRKDRKPLDRKAVAAFLDELSCKSSNARKALDQALDRVIVQKYGSREKLQEQVVRLLVHIAGLHVTPFPSDDFDYVLTVPGQVVQTNGQILSPDKVRWQFKEIEAYPLGYVMECRSLLAAPEVQTALLGNQPLVDREAMLAFVALLAGREPLQKALRECRRRKSRTPLYEYLEGPEATKDETERQAMRRLSELLRLPAKPQ